jgi:hypothetical protein
MRRQRMQNERREVENTRTTKCKKIYEMGEENL